MSATAPFAVPRQDLGSIEKTFETRSFSIARIAAFVACALCVGLAMVLLELEHRLAPASSMDGFGLKVAIGLGIIAFICLLAGLLHQVKANRVALYSSGVAVEAEGKVQALRWDEVRHYFNLGIGDSFRFTSLQGEDFSISGETAGFGDLCMEIRKRAGDEILRRELDLVLSGGDSRFGPLTLNRSGFRLDGAAHDWADVRELYSRVINGHETLVFEMGGVRGLGPSVAAEKLPSVHVCFRLVEQLAPLRLLKT